MSGHARGVVEPVQGGDAVDDGETAREDEGADGVEARLRWIHADDGGKLAAVRLRRADGEPGVPVVLVHGNYSDRSFWMTEDGDGLGPYLAREGFDVWVPELRGHGLSPKPEDFASITAEDHVRRDLPAVHDAVLEAGREPPIWVGHSAGGLYVLGALSRRWIEPSEVQAVAAFGAQVDRGEAYLQLPLVAPAVKGLLDLLGRLPAPTLGLGPEVEPAGEMKELVDWKAEGRWETRSGVSYRAGLGDLGVPFRAYAGAADEQDPPEGCRQLYEAVGSKEKGFVLLGEDEGFSRDYGHAEMVASSAAGREVWPDLLEWLDGQVG